jgi:hypothetical protein
MAVLTRREAQTAEAFFLTCKCRTAPRRSATQAERTITRWIDTDPDHALEVLTRLDADAIGVPVGLLEDFARRARYQVYADYPFPGRP